MDEVYIAKLKERLVDTYCPKCGRFADGGTSLNDTVAPIKPKPGDYALCLYCGSINIYTESLKLRPSRFLDRQRMLRDPRLSELARLASDVVKRHRRGIQ